MRVLIITTSFPAYEGHVQSPFIGELARHIANLAHVDVVCPLYKSSRPSGHFGKANIHRFTYFVHPYLQILTSGGGIPSQLKRNKLSYFQLPFFLGAMFFRSLRFARKADVIHCQWELSGLVGVILKKIFKKKLVLSTRGVSVDIASKKGILRGIYRWIFRNCDLITPNNLHHKEAIAKTFDVPSSRIISVPNGIDTAKYTIKDKATARKTIGRSATAPLILYVGWLIERKGVNYLIDAFSSVRRNHPDAELLIVGSGVEESKLKNIAGDGVHFLGEIPPSNVPAYMNASDMLVLPSLAEGRPNVVGESLACGTPAIVTDIPGSTELVDPSNGLTVPVRNAHAIASAIEKLLERSKNPQTVRASLLKKGASWDDCAKRFVSLYETL